MGVIGVGGRIGSLLEEDKLRQHPCTHLGAFTSIPECEVEAVCDIDFLRADVAAEKWKVPHAYNDYKEMTEKHALDIISVATPVQTHADIVCYLAMHSNRPKLIFCEKPLASNIEEAGRMVSVCNLNGVKLAVNFTRRWDVVYQQAKDVIDSGSLGELIRVIGYASREKDFPANMHMFDVLNWFSNGNLEKCLYIDCHPSEYLIFEVDILGVRGRILIVDNGRISETFISMASSHYEGINELAKASTSQYNPPTPMMRAAIALVNCVRENTEPLCTGQMGLDALRACCSMSTQLSMLLTNRFPFRGEFEESGGKNRR